MNRPLLLSLILALSATVGAAPEDLDSTPTEAAKADSAQQESEETSSPEPNRPKERDLAEALRTFTPSEAISADNAVPFPVDI